MPGIDHEMPLELIRNRPETALERLRCVTGDDIPPHAAARVETVDCTQAPIEFRADSVVVLRDETGAAQMAVIVEVQRGRDAGKRFSRPVYVISSLRPVTVKRLEEMVTTIQDFDYLGEKYFSHWLAKGEARGEIKSIFSVLDARGLEISDDARERICQCDDPNQLDAWVRKAAVITSADELFTE
ncbi:hypothetical protein [Microbispora sp. H10830]|uniref:hypothetical protein n=1 Tax=Microbispora sp. H10830 TaxID=2729109 RepID=UPI0016031D54|nr:hypothetical protein [Microbispora sp. H10830]